MEAETKLSKFSSKKRNAAAKNWYGERRVQSLSECVTWQLDYVPKRMIRKQEIDDELKKEN